jgi:hypothetical protein
MLVDWPNSIINGAALGSGANLIIMDYLSSTPSHRTKT